jgi:hypothetical protein
MNDWVWANIGKPVWLVLKRRGLNRDLRNLFMKRYAQLMNRCLFERHFALFQEILPGQSFNVSWTTMRMLLSDAHCVNLNAISNALECLKRGQTHSCAPSWTNPDETWRQKRKHGQRQLTKDDYEQNDLKWEVL